MSFGNGWYSENLNSDLVSLREQGRKCKDKGFFSVMHARDLESHWMISRGF